MALPSIFSRRGPVTQHTAQRSMTATRASEALQQMSGRWSHHELGLPPPGQVAGINRLAERAHLHPGLAHRPVLSLRSVEGSIRPTCNSFDWWNQQSFASFSPRNCSDCSTDGERGQDGGTPLTGAVYGRGGLTPLPRSTREVL